MNIKQATITACLCIILISCGKKAPLRPPEDVAPGVKVSIAQTNGMIIVQGTCEDGVQRTVVERNVGIIGNIKDSVMTTLFDGTGKDILIQDDKLVPGRWYQYRVIPYISKNKTGRIFISDKLTIPVMPAPPVNFSATPDENKGTILLKYEGGQCELFRIYRNVTTAKIGAKLYATTKEITLIDQFPVPDTEVVYEVRCVVQGIESGSNPSATVTFR